jgi:hypothetical protein
LVSKSRFSRKLGRSRGSPGSTHLKKVAAAMLGIAKPKEPSRQLTRLKLNGLLDKRAARIFVGYYENKVNCV